VEINAVAAVTTTNGRMIAHLRAIAMSPKSPTE
jgi:hypothetical protein